MQIGKGQYIPRNAQYFRFAPSLGPYYTQADLVVSHGGLGITMEALQRGKALIAVENTALHGGHQADLLSALAQQGHLIWCRDTGELQSALERAQHYPFKEYVAPPCEIHIRIQEYLRRIA
jgi:UDP-N-acetylglucosamine transferase subunit ALG13